MRQNGGKKKECIFSFLRLGIILWIELPWPENMASTYTWHTERLDSCFNLIRSHQQCILWSLPREIKSATTDCRAETLNWASHPYHSQEKRMFGDSESMA